MPEIDFSGDAEVRLGPLRLRLTAAPPDQAQGDPRQRLTEYRDWLLGELKRMNDLLEDQK